MKHVRFSLWGARKSVTAHNTSTAKMSSRKNVRKQISTKNKTGKGKGKEKAVGEGEHHVAAPQETSPEYPVMEEVNKEVEFEEEVGGGNDTFVFVDGSKYGQSFLLLLLLLLITIFKMLSAIVCVPAAPSCGKCLNSTSTSQL